MLRLNSERKKCYLNGSKFRMSTSPLPQDTYTQLEYLEFDGYSRLDSGVLASNDIGIEVVFSTTTASKWMFGYRYNAYYSGFLCGIFAAAPRAYVAYGGASASQVLTVNPLDGEKHTVLLDPVHYQMDSVEQAITRGVATSFNNIWIGSLYLATDLRWFVGKMYSFRLFEYSTGKDLFKGIPAKRKADNVCSFYDAVSGNFLTNAGSGTITGA